MAKWSDKESAIRALEKNGKVDPNDLIRAAQNPSHPCHQDFTWDVEQAAKERWRDQARYLIRKCRFDVTFEDVTSPVVQYVASNTEESVFVSLPKMRGKAAVRETMLGELDQLLYAHLGGCGGTRQHLVLGAVALHLPGSLDDLGTQYGNGATHGDHTNS